MASSRVPLSVVGVTSRPAIPEKATRPIRVPSFWALTNSRAASLAAASRLGAMSVVHIEPETSIANRIEVVFDGTVSDACGRASPPASASSPARKR